MTRHWITCLVIFVCLVLPVSSTIPGAAGFIPGNTIQLPVPVPYPVEANEPRQLLLLSDDYQDQGGFGFGGGLEMLIPLLLLPLLFSMLFTSSTTTASTTAAITTAATTATTTPMVTTTPANATG